MSAAATDTEVKVAVDKLPDQALNLTVASRVVEASSYGVRVRINPNGVIGLALVRDGASLAGGNVPDITASPGSVLRVRVQTAGTSPTTVRARVWLDGTTEPGPWQYTATDSTAPLQQPGSVRLIAYLSSGARNGPVTVRYDDLKIVTIPGF